MPRVALPVSRQPAARDHVDHISFSSIACAFALL